MKSLKLSLLGILLLVSLCSYAQTCANLPFGAVTQGSISTPAQVNRYCFTANAGDVIDFTITTSGISPKLQLYTSNGVSIGSDWLPNCSGTAMQWWGVTLPASPGNTYEILASDCADTGTGTYDLYTQRVNNPTGGISFSFGTIASASIGLPAQSNTYSFTANAGDYFTFSIVSTGLSPQLVLYNPDGTPFSQAWLPNCSGTAMNWTPGKPAPRAGNYTLLVNACGATATGTYSAYLQRTNNPGPPVTSILWGEDQAGSIAAKPGSQVYSFYGTANDVINFNIASTGFSPKLVLYNPNGTQFGGAWLPNCSGSSLQWNNVKLTQTGLFHLFASDCFGTLIGSYNLSTQCFGVCDQPGPVLASISPSSAQEGSAAVTLTATGSNFLSNSVVEWNGASLKTTYASSTKLTAIIPSSDMLIPGTFEVTVFTPTPGGGTSKPLPFTVLGPKITSLSPASVLVGSAAFTLTVTGQSFASGCSVLWNGSSLPTTYVSPTELRAAVPSTDLTVAAVVPITVKCGAASSPAFPFVVDNPPPHPSGLSPSSIIVGGTAFALTVNGSGFEKTSVVEWNGKTLPTTYVSASQLTAAVPVTDIMSGTVPITVFSPTPGGGLSGSFTFTIDNPVPVLVSLSPATVAHGTGAFAPTVNGYDFNEGARILWNGAALATTFLSDTQLRTTVPAADIASAGKATITVTNPVPTPTASNSLTITIN